MGLMWDIGVVLGKDNPKFDPQRFLKACEIDLTEEQ